MRRIVFYKGDRVFVEMRWPFDRASAIRHAVDYFPAYRTRGATSVVVVDEDRAPPEVIFAEPETAGR